MKSKFCITDVGRYIQARAKAENIINNNQKKAPFDKAETLVVASMQQAITACTNKSMCKHIRNLWIDTSSAEYYFQNSDGHQYVVAHGVGPLATNKGISQYLPLAKEFGLINIDNSRLILNTISIADVRKKKCDEPHFVQLTIPYDFELIPLTTDFQTVSQMQKNGHPIIYGRGKLNKDQFRLDDRILAACGDEETRQILSNILYNDIDKGGEGHKLVGSYHRIKTASYQNDILARPISLFIDDGGIGGCYYYGRFIVMTSQVSSK